MKDIKENSWLFEIWEYIESGTIPSNAEEIYWAGLNYLNSKEFRKTWNQPNQGKMTEEEWNKVGGKLTSYLVKEGYTDDNFRILIKNSIGGAFEYSFVLGSILRRNNIEHSWSESQSDWNNVLSEFSQLL
jgi:hypothetical protein